MNTHYLELQTSLEELSNHAEEALNPSYKVFPSENRLYTDSAKTNRRKHKCSIVVYIESKE